MFCRGSYQLTQLTDSICEDAATKSLSYDTQKDMGVHLLQARPSTATIIHQQALEQRSPQQVAPEQRRRCRHGGVRRGRGGGYVANADFDQRWRGRMARERCVDYGAAVCATPKLRRGARAARSTSLRRCARRQTTARYARGPRAGHFQHVATRHHRPENAPALCPRFSNASSTTVS